VNEPARTQNTVLARALHGTPAGCLCLERGVEKRHRVYYSRVPICYRQHRCIPVVPGSAHGIAPNADEGLLRPPDGNRQACRPRKMGS